MSIKIQGTDAELIGAKNPRWGDEDKTTVILECKFSHYADLGLTENDGYFEFLASPNDEAPHGREICVKAKAGDYGTIGDYVAPAPQTSGNPDPS